jgi:hypothetical protein
VAVDATPKPGPKKVFNFLGQLAEEEVEQLRQLQESTTAHHLVYFGHYPSSCIVAPHPGFRALIQGGLVYLSGEGFNGGGLVHGAQTAFFFYKTKRTLYSTHLQCAQSR